MALRIAVEGCGHGTLDAIYASVAQSCATKGWDSVDCLIIGGDFQAVRNAHDLNCLAVPSKYRALGDFHRYYSGARTAPYLTIFVGGNHEASNYLQELYYGGWVAPNIYYLGAANVIRLGPLRIAAISGIWKGYSYRRPHYERLPFNQDDIKSIYHVRELDVRKLLQLRTQVDVGISHDWPQGVEWEGDYEQLFKKKKDFEADARVGKLGSVAAKSVLEKLMPPYWFSAHLHIRYTATIEIEPGKASLQVRNEDEIPLDIDDEEIVGPHHVSNVVDKPEDVGQANDSEEKVEPHRASNVLDNAQDVGQANDEIHPDTLEVDVVKPNQVSDVVDNAQDVGQANDPIHLNTTEVDIVKPNQVSKVVNKSQCVEQATAQNEDDDHDNSGRAATDKGLKDHPEPVHNDDEIELDLTDEDIVEPEKVTTQAEIPPKLPSAVKSGIEDTGAAQDSKESPGGIRNRKTRFLALDKCLPGRAFLQLMEIAPFDGGKVDRPLSLEYDPEWLAIVKVFADMLILDDPHAIVPSDEGEEFYRPLISEEETWVDVNLVQQGKMRVPENFERTAPTFDPNQGVNVQGQPREYNNPQTQTFCELLQIANPFHSTEEEISARAQVGPRPSSAKPNGGWRGRGRSRGGFRGSRGGTSGRGSARGWGRG